MKAGEGILDFAAVQSGAGEPYGLSADRPMGALHLIELNGEKRRGAEAVFRMMDLCNNHPGRVAWWLYGWCGPFRFLSKWGYGLVSARRATLSRMTCSLGNRPDNTENSHSDLGL
jgi:hypothetical protein